MLRFHDFMINNNTFFGIIVLVTFVCIYGFISLHFLQAAMILTKVTNRLYKGILIFLRLSFINNYYFEKIYP